MRNLPALLFIIHSLQLSQLAYGQTGPASAVLQENPGQASLDGHIEYLEDNEGLLTIDEVASSADFTHAGNDTPNFGFTNSVYWFRFSITNNTKQNTLLLEQGYTHLDYISLFSRNQDGGFKEEQSGDMLPFKHRARPYRTITFQMNIEPRETKTFFVRTQTSGSIQLPLTVYKEVIFSQVSERESAALGAYYGIILVMIVFNMLLWMSLRDKTYLSYVGYLVFYLLGQLALNGNAFRYLFSESPNLNSVALPFSMFMGFLFAFRFTREFMILENILPKASRTIIWVERILLVAALISIWAPYAIIIKPAALVAVLAPFTFLVIGFICLQKGYRPAKTYLIAWSVLLIGAIVMALKNFGILPSNAFTEFAIQVGSALEVTLLSLALADRIHVIQEQRELALAAESAAHYSLAESYQALHIELERRKAAEDNLALELKARSHLVSEAAHRLNNPLNISMGGIGILEEKLKNHVESLQSVFEHLEPESNQETIWLAGVKDDLKVMQSASTDAHDALCRANDFLAEFRAVGGLRGARNSFVPISQIIERAQARILADTGASVALDLELHNTAELTVWSNEYVAALLLSYCVNTMAASGCTQVVVSEASEQFTTQTVVLKICGVGASTGSKAKDLLGLCPVQLGEAVGNRSPRIRELVNEDNSLAYFLDFESHPPESHVERDNDPEYA
jgi:signal transduction histidine kinase